jgi:vitamin B12 transporter
MRLQPFSVALPLAFSAILGLSPGPVRAGAPTPFSDEITVTATGSEEAVDEVPVPVTVIDRTEIEDSGADTVADLLRRVPGLVVVRAGDEGKVPSLFTRGTESDHTLVMLDGIRLNSPYFGGYDWSQLPTTGLERIEVARGPFSALWGADAVGGVINMVTRRGHHDLEVGATAEGGQNAWRRLETDVAWGNEHVDVFASAFDRSAEGELDNSDFASRELLADVGWTASPGRRIAILVQDGEVETGIPFSDPLTPTPARRQTSRQRVLAAPVSWRVTDSWELTFSAARIERDFRYRDPDDPFGYTASDTTADTDQLRATSRHRIGTHSLTLGGEWRADTVDDRSAFGINLDGASSTVRSAFVQDVWTVSSVRVIAGARWDDTDAWGSRLSPRLDVGWEIGSGFEIRGGWGEAFRQPSVGELFFPFSGNPELRPEEARSWEAGVSWVPTMGTHRVRLTTFETRVTDLVEYDYLSSRFANIASARMRGIEAGWEKVLNAGMTSSVAVTWLDTRDDDGMDLLRRPAWSATWTVSGALTARLRGDLSLVWLGPRDDVDPISFQRTKLGGAVTSQAALAWRILDHADAVLRILNLADHHYEEVAGYPAPGRRITAGLRLRL